LRSPFNNASVLEKIQDYFDGLPALEAVLVVCICKKEKTLQAYQFTFEEGELVQSGCPNGSIRFEGGVELGGLAISLEEYRSSRRYLQKYQIK